MKAPRRFTVEHDQGQADPPDLETMRAVVDRLLDPDATPETLPPAADELEMLTLQLRTHLQVLMPEVERVALGLSKESIPRYCALACLGEARMKLGIEPRPGPSASIAHARRLARVLNALCDHYANLTGEHI
ncbi:DUF6415 family natural product biosynthesis protein [Streptomyces sp. NPDC006365]|uniref:DUF6415 family natural product biosynthesis protein n=1 Tax=Streptomyces sp. NPDC006365 TaxID=3364744 RepID=UPI0036967B35